ncbi:hypothetical protein B0H11DRAFT_519833 [Mycena galericulata]|nr:hypothetical protein B0H11DRAFT_519833 [Mycena galericulata]
MNICGLPLSWPSLIHTSLEAWPIEYALPAFVRRPLIASSPPKVASTHVELKPTLTSFHVLGPTLHLVATACSLAIIVGLTSLALLLLLWSRRPENPTPKPGGVLSERAVLRIYEIASRQPYPMPPDDGGGDDTFPALPFANNARKQSLFIFWLFLLVVGCAIAYALSPIWFAVVASFVADKRSRLSWTLTLILSAILANISGQFLRFAFILWAVMKSTIQWAKWMVLMISVEPAVTAHSAYLQVTRIAHYLSHWCFGSPLDQPLPQHIDRSATFMSFVASALGGYHLISSRVVRNYMVILKSIIHGSRKLGHLYFSWRQAPIFPTNYFQYWAWWVTKYVLTFSLGELSWTSISWPKLLMLLGPTIILCAHGIYKYNQVIVPPRSHLQLALDPISREQRRQAIELMDVHRLLKNLDHQFANTNFVRLSPGVPEQSSP